MHKIMVFVTLAIISMISGCGSFGCSAYGTSMKEIERNDKFVLFEHSAVSESYALSEDSKYEKCRHGMIEFWLEVQVMNWDDGSGHKTFSVRPKSPPYEILSRRLVKSGKKLRDPNLVYLVKVMIEDINESIEKAINN